MEEREEVSLSNLCNGAIEEVFQREWAEVMRNIGDVNTPAEAKRKVRGDGFSCVTKCYPVIRK